jgi:hypothetical protein
MVYEFVSEGPKGKIPKLVIYEKTNLKGFYNLAFGDKNAETGEIDDEVITNNDDSQKVLATVAATVYAFTHKYSDAWVAATRSSKSRNRLYQIGISNNLEEIKTDFIIYGLKDKKWEKFQKGVIYEAFLIKRK